MSLRMCTLVAHGASSWLRMNIIFLLFFFFFLSSDPNGAARDGHGSSPPLEALHRRRSAGRGATERHRQRAAVRGARPRGCRPSTTPASGKCVCVCVCDFSLHLHKQKKTPHPRGCCYASIGPSIHLGAVVRLKKNENRS